MRCYFASPYSSHVVSRHAAVQAAMGAVLRLPLHVCLHVDEVAQCASPCVWSPLLHGQWLLWHRGGNFNEKDALEWCLWCLEHKGFDTLIISDTIPRAKGYGSNGVDAERALAEKLGLYVLYETDVEQWAGY